MKKYITLRLFILMLLFSSSVFSQCTITLSGTSAGAKNQTICLGDSITPITFTASGTSAATLNGGATSAGLTISGTSTVVVSGTPNSSGTLNYTVTTSGGCGAGGPGSITGTITVNALPSNKTVAAAQGTVCSGTGTNITVTNSTNGVSYQLRDNSNNSNIGSAVTGTGGAINLPTGNLSIATTFNVLATTGAGCSLQMTNTPTVTINPLPQGSLSANGPFCATGAGQLTWTATAGSGLFTVVYNDGVANRTKTNVTSGTAFATFTTPVTSTTTYTLVSVTDANGCVQSSGFTGSSATITVNPLPQGSLTGSTICSGDTGTLTFTSTSGTGPFNLTITGTPYTGEVSGTSFNASPNPASTTTYNLTVITDANGCTRNSGITGPSATITVNAAPVDKTVAAAATTICSGTGTNITVTNSTSGVSYQLRDNSNSSNIGSAVNGTGGTINLPTGNLSSTTTFNVLASIAGCTSLQMTIKPTVTVNTLPADLSVVALASSVCSGTGTSIQVVNSESNVNYQLRNNAGNVLIGSSVAGTGSTINLPTGNLASATTFNVLATTGAGCSLQMTTTATVTVNSLPTMTSASSKTICNNVGININLTANIGATFVWNTNDNVNTTGESTSIQNTSSLNDIISNSSTSVQTLTYTVIPTSTGGGCTGSSQNVTITSIPTVTMTSTNAQTICNNGTENIPLTANVPATFVWLAANNPNTTGESTSNQSTGTLNNTINNSSAVIQTVSYTVTPTSTSGSCAGTPQTVNITSIPTVTMMSSNAQTICNNGTENILLSANIPASFSWLATDNPNTTGESTSPQITGTLNNTINNSSSSIQTLSYTVTPTSTSGSCAGTSQTVTITSIPTVNMTSANASSVCSEVLASIPLTANIPSTFNWQAADNINTTGESTSLQTTSTLSNTIINNTNVSQVVVYTVTPTSTSGGCPGVSQTVNVTVKPLPTITNSPASLSQTICSNTTTSPVTITTIGVAGTSINWSLNSLPAGVTVIPNTSGSTSTIPSDTINSNLTTQSTITFAITTTANGCFSSATDTVFVNPSPVVPDDLETICSGTSFNYLPIYNPPNTIVFSNTTYSWGSPNPPSTIVGASSASGLHSVSQSLTNNSNIQQTLTYTVSASSGTVGSCPGASTFEVIVHVDPTPVIPDTVRTICSGTAFTVNPTDNSPNIIVPVGTTYAWSAPTYSYSGSISGGSAQSAQPMISQTLTNNTDSIQTAIYTVTPKSGNCDGIPFTITVFVNPKPVIQSTTLTICGNSTFLVNPTNAQPTTIVPNGTTYTWTYTGNNITGGSAQSNQSSISQTLIDTTNITQTANYTVIPTSGAAVGGCIGSPFNINVQVNPTPLIPNQRVTICGDSTFLISPTNAQPIIIVPAGTTYTWGLPSNTGNITGATAQTNHSDITDLLINITNTSQTTIYTVTPKAGVAAGGCIGQTFYDTIVVNPRPDIVGDSSAACSGSTFSYNPTTHIVPANTKYTWTFSSAGNHIFGGSSQSDQSAISQTLSTSPNDTARIAIYTVTPVSGSCVGHNFTILDTVNSSPAQPVVSDLTTNDSTVKRTLCGGTINMSFNIDSLPNTTYLWAVSPFPTDSVRNKTSPNTVISFGDSSNVYTSVVSVTATINNVDGMKCGSVPDTLHIKIIPSGDSISVAKIDSLQAGNLLWYEDNTVDGYQWGYDSIDDKKPHIIAGQVYQVFVADARFLLNGKLNRSKYWFWVTVNRGDCKTKVYYNGPYSEKYFTPTPDVVPDFLSADILPNPNDGIFNLVVKGNIFGKIKIKVTNILGQAVYEQNVDKVTGIQTYQLETPNLEKGIYMIQLEGTYNERILSKLVISK